MKIIYLAVVIGMAIWFTVFAIKNRDEFFDNDEQL